MMTTTSTALCACGCGTPINSTDSRGRPRQYAVGHSGGGSLPYLEPTTDLARRLAWLMQHGPNGPMRQIDVARRAEQLGLGLNPTEVNRLVTGRSDPLLSTLAKLAKVLGVPLAELVQTEQQAARTATLPRATWTGKVFSVSEDESVDVTSAVLPEPTNSLVVIPSPSANAVPLAFPDDLLVVDLQQRQPVDGALMLIIPHPRSKQLQLMRAFLEEDGLLVRFADASGYVLGSKDIVKGEVLAILSKVGREPAGSTARVWRSLPVSANELVRLGR